MSNRNTSGLSGQTTQVNHMLDLRERTQTLSALAGYFAFYGVGDNLLSGSGEPERLSGVPVSGNFFDVLGIRPAARPVLQRGREPVERTEGGRAGARAVAATVQLGSEDCRHGAHA